MITITKQEEMEKYYDDKTNTYVFNDNVEFLIDINIEENIKAYDINAGNIRAYDIDACNINAGNINAHDIDAGDIDANDIKASDIDACDIKASNINAHDIDAWDINANNINANNISYYAVCFAYKNIVCNSIQGRRKNAKHFALDGDLIINGNKTK